MQLWRKEQSSLTGIIKLTIIIIILKVFFFNFFYIRIVSEWKGKVSGLSLDLDVSQNETRNASSELFRIKSAYDESILQLDEVRRENKNLSNEIKDIMDQISEGGRSIHEIDKIRFNI